MNWARILAFVTGAVDQELLARAEYLAAENRILKSSFTLVRSHYARARGGAAQLAALWTPRRRSLVTSIGADR